MAVNSASDSTLSWPLAGDPAIRWQVRRDFLDASSAAVARDQRRVATEGWNARLLLRSKRRKDGRWAKNGYRFATFSRGARRFLWMTSK